MSERPVDEDGSPGSEPPAERRPQSSYWEPERSAELPKAFLGPAFERSGAAIEPAHLQSEAMANLRRSSGAPRFDRSDAMLEAILTDGDSSAVHGEPAAAGGPHFVAVRPTTVPLLPPGVRIPNGVAPGAPGPKVMRKPRRSRRLLVALLVVAALGAGAYAAYPRVRAMIAARSVPAALRSYVQGSGVRYAPPGLGYSVRLPARPTRRDPQLADTARSLSTIAHWSIVAGDGYQIVVWEADLPAPAKTIFPEGLLGALADPHIGGGGGGGGFTRVHRAKLAGETAYEGDLSAANVEAMHVGVLIHGSRLYVIRVQSRSPGTVFDAVAKSLRLSG